MHASRSDSSPSGVPLGKLLEPLKKPLKCHWRLAALTIVAGWGKFVLPTGVPLITGHLIDEVLLKPANGETQMELLRLGAIALVLLVLDKGRLAERGNYTELKARNGIFTKLLEEQKLGEEMGDGG